LHPDFARVAWRGLSLIAAVFYCALLEVNYMQRWLIYLLSLFDAVELAIFLVVGEGL
jgi:hypothetical protein